jgi:hypothetical protein
MQMESVFAEIYSDQRHRVHDGSPNRFGSGSLRLRERREGPSCIFLLTDGGHAA